MCHLKYFAFIGWPASVKFPLIYDGREEFQINGNRALVDSRVVSTVGKCYEVQITYLHLIYFLQINFD